MVRVETTVVVVVVLRSTTSATPVKSVTVLTDPANGCGTLRPVLSDATCCGYSQSQNTHTTLVTELTAASMFVNVMSGPHQPLHTAGHSFFIEKCVKSGRPDALGVWAWLRDLPNGCLRIQCALIAAIGFRMDFLVFCDWLCGEPWPTSFAPHKLLSGTLYPMAFLRKHCEPDWMRFRRP